MPAILAFDTATGPVSVALRKGGKLLYYQEEKLISRQSATLMPMIENALKAGGLGYRDLTIIASTIGPGSFTGIRVGLATARGLCLASGIKGAGFTTLEVMAHAARKPGSATLAVLNAGKGEQYYQGFDMNGKPLFEPKLGSAEAASMPAGFVTAEAAPRADALADLAASTYESAAALNPFYIRLPDAIPLKPGQTIL